MSKTKRSSPPTIVVGGGSVVVVNPFTPQSLPVISFTSSMAMSPNWDLASVAEKIT